MIRNATMQDMPEVAKLHIACFPDSFSTKFGAKLLARYYGEFLTQDHLFVVAEEGGALVGLCMGYRKGSPAQDLFVKHNLLGIGLRCAGLIVTLDREVLQKIKKYVCGKLRTHRTAEPAVGSAPAAADLLSICVSASHRGSDVAGKLVAAYEEALKAQGLFCYQLCVKSENKRAQAFYQKQGIQCVRDSGSQFLFEKSLGDGVLE